jgi:hypothetical protein
MVEVEKYSFSFTACTMRLNNFMRLFQHLGVSEGEIGLSSVDQEEILNKGNQGSSKREMQELLKRYNALTTHQKEMFEDATLDERKHLLFLSICKSNAFFRDFVVEIVRERSLVFDFELDEGDFNSFLNRKSELHPELEQFADSTKKKAKQHLWKIMEEAGLIDDVSTKKILHQWISPKLLKVILEDDVNYLKIFLMSDSDIQQALKQ